jgi:hypothetical protein
MLEEQVTPIKVYKHTWLGRRLVGWVDESGVTYRYEWPSRPRQINWYSDKHGRIFIEFNGLRGLVGRLGSNGAVHAEYGQAHGMYFRPPRYLGPGQKKGFAPALVFWVGNNGAVYGRRLLATRKVGTVEGTSDLVTIAGLALLLLL